MSRTARRDVAMLLIGLLAGAGALYAFQDRNAPVSGSLAAERGHGAEGGHCLLYTSDAADE